MFIGDENTKIFSSQLTIFLSISQMAGKYHVTGNMGDIFYKYEIKNVFLIKNFTFLKWIL